MKSSIAPDAKRGRNERREGSHGLIENAGPSFSSLPKSILEIIILRLSVKRIFVCKSVCKAWRDLISDPGFAKLHFNQAEVCPLIRSSGSTFLSRMVYLVHPEREEFEHKLDICNHYNNEGCNCCVKVKLDTKFKLPLCNLEKILNDRDGDLGMLNSESGGLKLKMRDHKYRIVNSCNGLLCLSDRLDNDPVIVCNPITGEFINLPENKTSTDGELDHIDCGFGFCPSTNQYKVIRMFLLMIRDGITITHRMVAEVHILGTRSWKNLGCYPNSMYKLFPTCLNGFIHWFSEENLISFDLEKECFGSVELPPLEIRHELSNVELESRDGRSNVAMGVLGGEICITEVYDGNIDFWVMNSAEKCFSKLFLIRIDNPSENGSYQPIKYLNNGAILIFHSGSNGLLYLDPKKDGYKYLKVRGIDLKLEVIPHIPSFVSLEDILPGDDVEILNVKSRCGIFRLHNEGKTVTLVRNGGNRL